MSLSVTNTLIRAVEKVGLAKIRFGETHFFNGPVQRIDHTQRQQGLYVLVNLTLYFQNHHHLSPQLFMSLCNHLCRGAGFVWGKNCAVEVVNSAMDETQRKFRETNKGWAQTKRKFRHGETFVSLVEFAKLEF